MKNNDVFSAVIGGVFFAIPYLALSLPIVPSVAIGTAAFCAGELVFRTNEKEQKKKMYSKSINKILKDAKDKNLYIKKMYHNIESDNIKNNLNEISKSVDKIIKTIEKSPKKIKNIDNFFDYYLPITVKIIDRYNEIEDQNLSSIDSKKFIKETDKMIEEINDAYKKILDKLYQSEMIDIGADMKVFDTMLKSDGFNSDEIEVSKEVKNG